MPPNEEKVNSFFKKSFILHRALDLKGYKPPISPFEFFLQVKKASGKGDVFCEFFDTLIFS
ncbi:MAG: hypothetical protein A2Z25_09715 [Planctomycetes bacterium RBG_16_55_9]|nr:MAG: hypothetical protein A2Z25_09715 [Planctomycetes bacterium RBG_16_55_9]